MEVQSYKNKLSKKESDISKYTESISALETKASYWKVSLQEKEGEVATKDSVINSLRKENENLKIKNSEEIKSKGLERE